MRILVDMDGVLTDFDRGILDIYRRKHPDKPFIPLEQRTTFYNKEQYPDELKPLIEEIYLSKGFYSSLPIIEGSLEALTELAERGNELFICTSPLLENPYCIQEKYDWVIKHLGKSWTKKTIISKDKTVIQGDILIDDKPEIKGIQEPIWEHILYSQPYNQQITSKRRLTWQNWKEVLGFK